MRLSVQKDESTRNQSSRMSRRWRRNRIRKRRAIKDSNKDSDTVLTTVFSQRLVKIFQALLCARRYNLRPGKAKEICIVAWGNGNALGGFYRNRRILTLQKDEARRDEDERERLVCLNANLVS